MAENLLCNSLVIAPVGLVQSASCTLPPQTNNGSFMLLVSVVPKGNIMGVSSTVRIRSEDLIINVSLFDLPADNYTANQRDQ
ncbi:hypothetical protein MWK82_19495 [Escherichia coli]|nr:hypothetical protein [Escherichia coli]